MSLLEVRDLTVAFGSTEVVRGVSFTVETGERVCLIGESGSGKSMTAMAIQGLLPRAARVTGSIRFEGRELVGASDAEFQKIRGRRIGCIFQEPHTALNPVVRIKHQLVAASRIHTGLKKSATTQRASELARMVKLPSPEHIINRFPHELSGGQRQRVVIAMAMSLAPALLIADEPTTALDATVQAHILQLMDDAAREHGTAVLMITHDMAVAYHTSERILVLRRGELVEEGSAEDILLRPVHPYTQGLVAAARATSLQRPALRGGDAQLGNQRGSMGAWVESASSRSRVRS
ncbi:ATP-binding cassette domain-containing protein [Actinotignum schaalii]